MLRVLNWSIHPSTPKIVLEYMKQIIFFDSDQQLVGCTSEDGLLSRPGLLRYEGNLQRIYYLFHDSSN